MTSPEEIQIIQSLTRFCCQKGNSDKTSGLNPELESQILDILNQADAKVTGECEMVQENLIDYLDGQLSEPARLHLSEHLKECDLCSFIHDQVKQPVNFEADELESIPVPDDLLENIKRHLPRSGNQQTVREKVAQKIDELKVIFEFIIAPVPEPEPALLSGSGTRLSRQIQHTGGILMISIGEPEKVVRLFTPQNVEIDLQHSDHEGKLSFGSLPAGEYKVRVSGCQIVEIKRSEL